jgi:hypothetical protein
MKKIIVLLVALLFVGCAEVLPILDIFTPLAPVPVCDKDSVGATYKGQQCLKYSDGSYRWVEVK